MDIEGIDDKAIDHLLIDCADVAVAVEIEKQRKYIDERLRFNPHRKPEEPNPFCSRSSSFRDPKLKDSSFVIHAWDTPDSEGRSHFILNYSEAMPLQFDTGETVKPVKVCVDMKLTGPSGQERMWSVKIGSISFDQDDYKEENPRPVRRFDANAYVVQSQSFEHMPAPELLCLVDAKLKPLFKKWFVSARNLILEHCGEVAYNNDTQLRERLDRAVVNAISESVGTSGIREIVDRSMARGRIKQPNILQASLPHMLIDDVRGIIARACPGTFRKESQR